MEKQVMVGQLLLRYVRKEMEKNKAEEAYSELVQILVDKVLTDKYNNDFLGKIINEKPWKESCRAAILGLFV